jgi:hypothetical protein
MWESGECHIVTLVVVILSKMRGPLENEGTAERTGVANWFGIAAISGVTQSICPSVLFHRLVGLMGSLLALAA